MSLPPSPSVVLAPSLASKEEQPQTGGERQNEWRRKADVVRAGGRRGGEGPAERGWEVLHSVEEEPNYHFPVTIQRHGWGVSLASHVCIFICIFGIQGV
jgi:hypothetical protein